MMYILILLLWMAIFNNVKNQFVSVFLFCLKFYLYKMLNLFSLTYILKKIKILNNFQKNNYIFVPIFENDIYLLQPIQNFICEWHNFWTANYYLLIMILIYFIILILKKVFWVHGTIEFVFLSIPVNI